MFPALWRLKGDPSCCISSLKWKLCLYRLVYRGPVSTALWNTCSLTPAPLYLLNWHVTPPHCAGMVNILTSLLKWVPPQSLAGAPCPDQMGSVVESALAVKRICVCAAPMLPASFPFWSSCNLKFRRLAAISLFNDLYVSGQLTVQHTVTCRERCSPSSSSGDAGEPTPPASTRFFQLKKRRWWSGS